MEEKFRASKTQAAQAAKPALKRAGSLALWKQKNGGRLPGARSALSGNHPRKYEAIKRPY